MDGALNKVGARPIKLAGSAQLRLATNHGRAWARLELAVSGPTAG